MYRLICCLVIVAAPVVRPTTLQAKEEGARTDPSLLNIDRIYASDEFKADGLAARWLEDGSGYVTLEANAEFGGQDIVCHDPETGNAKVMVSASLLIPEPGEPPLAIEDYAFSNDLSLLLIYTNSKRVWRKNTRGDYWVLDRAARDLWQVGGDANPSTLMFAKLSPTSTHVAYVRENNLYAQDLRSREVTALTASESPNVINGTFDWVYEEELGLRDGFRWSPDGRSIAFWQIDTTGVQTFTMINNTDSLYPRVIPFAYPKTGQVNSICRVGVVKVEGGATRWINVPGDPRDHYIARMDWRPGEPELVIQQLNRLQNANQVMLADPVTGEVRRILTERDDAWVWVHDETHWLEDDDRFTWVSERDGWRHVYVASASSDSLQLATPGEFDAIELLQVDQQHGWLYYLASPDNAAQRYLYRSDLNGANTQRLTPSELSGSHSYQISPDARWAIHTYSSFDVPPTIELIRLPSHESARVLVDNKKLKEKLEKLKRQPAEFFRITTEAGVTMDAWCIKPPRLNPAKPGSKKYPLLVYVYGEPAGQTVVDRWGGSGYLWHQMMAQRGYVVVSIDNRGTRSPKGREWRRSIYRKIGIIAPQDQADAIHSLLESRPYLDADRVGVWGWSGGGSMSLNAIFKFPDLYKTAVAIAPVPNQRYYDTIYQERYMGLPSDNVEGYREGSPINFASRLEGNLLIIHGTGDDNCHYQTTEMLINELILHNKQFSMMAYPNRTHSIREGKNTTRHLRSLMTSYFEQNLPPGPK